MQLLILLALLAGAQDDEEPDFAMLTYEQASAVAVAHRLFTPPPAIPRDCYKVMVGNDDGEIHVSFLTRSRTVRTEESVWIEPQPECVGDTRRRTFVFRDGELIDIIWLRE